MSVFLHAIVWIDPAEATVSRFRGNVESDVDVHSHAPLQKLHHLRTGWEAGGRLADRTGFYGQIAAAIATYSDIVITGPGNTKFELKAFLDEHHPQISVRVEESTPGTTVRSPNDA